jgi:hypothetical protein
MYNANGGWVGAYAVYMGPVNTGRLLFEGDGQFVNGRILERHSFAVLESDYDEFGWNAPSPTILGDSVVGSTSSSPAAKSLNERTFIVSGFSALVVFGAAFCR